MGDITLILQRANQGDDSAQGELIALVYGELRSLAQAKMAREDPDHTLQPTALVHEAWLRLGGDAQPPWDNRRHYFAAAAEAMRRILIERARRRQAVRHGAGMARGSVDELEFVAGVAGDDAVLAVNDALEKLARADAPKAELVKLRYFAGFSLEEAAQAMGISPTTASRWWAFSRAWLLDELSGEKDLE